MQVQCSTAMDIDDILREVDPAGGAAPRGKRDLQELTRAWVAERSAPELLEYVSLEGSLPLCVCECGKGKGKADVCLGCCFFRWPADGLFERINERIKTQIERVEEMTGDMDPKTNFALIVIQTELERYKFLVRSYLRARIAKVNLLLPLCLSCL